MLLMMGMMVTIRMLLMMMLLLMIMMRMLPSLTWFVMTLMMNPLLAANVPWAF